MKIAHIVHHFPPESNAGCENYVLSLATRQAGKGHNVRVLTRAIINNALSPTQQEEQYESISVLRLTDPVEHMDDWHRLRSAPIAAMLQADLAAFQPDVVHIHHWLSLTVDLVAICHELGLKTIITLHDLFLTCPTGHRLHVDGYFCEQPVDFATCARCLQTAGQQPLGDATPDQLKAILSDRQSTLAGEIDLADAFVIAHPVFGAFVRRFAPVPADKTWVVPMPTTELPACPEPAGAAPLHLVHFGNLNEHKAPHLILDAVRLLDPGLRARIQISLFGFIHQADYAARLQEKAEGLNVYISNERYRPADLARHSFDICILPSNHYESFSFTLSEAIQLELPLIVADGGVPAARLGGCGLTFRRGDAADLAQKIWRLGRDYERRQACRAACRQAKKEMLTLEDHTVQILSCYEQIRA